jgi:predicted pyridoxine 5'-phosphate oxidase superfamily flavin-nucleotide-binding protein
MGKLTPEMKEMLEKKLTIVATADKSGIPNIGPKGSTMVVDDDTLAYSESTGGKTLRNLEQNPHISVLIFDDEKREGYQFKGSAELVKKGPLFETISERQTKRKRPLPKVVVKITLTEIYTFKTGFPGTRVA